MKKTASSRLRQKLTLQSETRTPDGAGGFTRGWDDVAEIWAEVLPLTGREQLAAVQMETVISHRILARTRVGIDASQRFVSDGKYFYIRSILAPHRSDVMEILAEEKNL